MMALAGRLLQLIAAIHAAYGLWFGRSVLGRIARDGVVNAVDPHLDRNLVFWFLFASPLLAMLGQLLVWLDRRSLAPPRWLAWELSVTCVLGLVLMPASGFWLVLAPCALLILASREGTRGTV
jgi:hypothetical protein